MNAHALLTAQGWRGTGHSLHASDDSVGLAKPILVSRKNDTRGIGKKSHATSDQWWLNAFDEQLRSMEVSAAKGVVVTAPKATRLESIAPGTGKYRGLYSNFVSGGLLQGTATPAEEGGGGGTDATPAPGEGGEKKKKEEESAKRREESREERRARKEAKRRRRAEREARRAGGSGTSSVVESGDSAPRREKTRSKKRRRSGETKEERRARKEAKRKRREERAKRKESQG